MDGVQPLKHWAYWRKCLKVNRYSTLIVLAHDLGWRQVVWHFASLSMYIMMVFEIAMMGIIHVVCAFPSR